MASSLIPSTTSYSPSPVDLFKRPCASQSLLKELNAESSCVDRLLIGLLALSSLLLLLLLMLFLLLTEEGGLGGATSWDFLLNCRFSGNDLGDEDGAFLSASTLGLTAVSDDDPPAESRFGCSCIGVDGGMMYSLHGGIGGGL